MLLMISFYALFSSFSLLAQSIEQVRQLNEAFQRPEISLEEVHGLLSKNAGDLRKVLATRRYFVWPNLSPLEIDKWQAVAAEEVLRRFGISGFGSSEELRASFKSEETRELALLHNLVQAAAASLFIGGPLLMIWRFESLSPALQLGLILSLPISTGLYFYLARRGISHFMWRKFLEKLPEDLKKSVGRLKEYAYPASAILALVNACSRKSK